MKSRKSQLLFGTALIILILILVFWYIQNKNISVNEMNKNLDVGEIELGMSESDVIQHWGQGEYLDGFGGHGREYKDREIRVGFPDDMDNDLYKKVSSLEFSNANFSIFSVKVGDDMDTGVERILSTGFKTADYSEDTFVNGEYSITLIGQEMIEAIRILFSDKDLKDRNY
jgi:hypothetical protein